MMTKYVVANPRNIPKGVHVLRTDGDVLWYEGDDFIPKGMKDEELKELRSKGFLKKVKAKVTDG